MQAATGTLFRVGRPEEFDTVCALLAQCGLPADDLAAAHMDDFIVAAEGERIVGSAAVQRFGDDGLLRSVAVAPSWRGQGLGAALVEAVEQRARSQGLRALWLLTTTAADYFAVRGWRPVSRESAPAPVRASSQFAVTCPSSAACMVKPLA